MLYHRVEKKVWNTQRNGKLYHGYLAQCGAKIVSDRELDIGSQVAVGPEPHTWCAQCFKHAEEHIDVQLPDSTLSAPVYDENGKLLKGVREREEGLSPPVNTHEVNLGDNNGLGQYENRPFG
jgi:hypothetical protein